MNFMSVQVNHDNSHEKQTYMTNYKKRQRTLTEN